MMTYLILCNQRQASLSTLQSKLAKQKRDVKNDVNSAANKKKSRKAETETDNKVNAVKQLQQMKSVDESQKPTMNGDKKNKKDKRNVNKTPPTANAANDVKIQVGLVVINNRVSSRWDGLIAGPQAPKFVWTGKCLGFVRGICLQGLARGEGSCRGGGLVRGAFVWVL